MSHPDEVIELPSSPSTGRPLSGANERGEGNVVGELSLVERPRSSAEPGATAARGAGAAAWAWAESHQGDAHAQQYRPGRRSHSLARVAVLIPCLNEETTIGTVVHGFRASLPDAQIYVYDNGSTDATAKRARDAGATVRHEARPGKGHVVRRMFAQIDADVYLLVDGDGTYDPTDGPEMVRRVWDEGFDMVVGKRMAEGAEAYRFGHRTGNVALTEAVARLFGRGPGDMLSGYRAVSRAYVTSFPVRSSGFEIETEMAIHALSMQLATTEVNTRYTERPTGSHSKLRTVPDGFRILRLILRILRDFRPVALFGLLAVLVLCGGGALMIFGAIAAGQQWILATLFVSCSLLTVGVAMDSVGQGRREMKHMMYLAARLETSGSRAEPPLSLELRDPC